MSASAGFRLFLRLLALLFAAATTLYSVVWMRSVGRRPSASLGIEFADVLTARVAHVAPASTAAHVGLRPGDRILAIDGQRLDTGTPFHDRVFHGRPGGRVRLTVERDGRSFVVDAILMTPSPRTSDQSRTRRLAGEILALYPVLFLIVVIAVLVLRPDDRNGWLLALIFGGFIAAAPLFELETPPGLRRFVVAYKVAFQGAAPGLFLYFFSVFPASSPLDRRAPWLKTLWLTAGLAVSVPLGLWGLAAGSSHPLVLWARELSGSVRGSALVTYFFGGFGLGLVSLTWNALRGPAPARRKSRVIVWGTVVGLGPAFVLYAVAAVAGKDPSGFPFWIWAPCIMALFLIPLAFGYAVVKHRVLELPVLLKRSARYLLVQRGSVGLLVLGGVATTMVFASSVAGRLKPRTEAAGPLAIGLGAAFGTLLVWTGTAVQRRVRERIDRAFFRSAYDARRILEDLAEKARSATSRESLAALLEHHVRSALSPRSLAVYLESDPGLLRVNRGQVPAGLETLPTSMPALVDLARRGRSREVPPPGGQGREDLAPLAPLEPECLVPILGRDGRLSGLLALGPLLSEEPYSREDRRLLASVASQAGTTLESIQLAEHIAQGLESERRAADELHLAKQVQSRLLPQQPPALATLECAGCCVQARAVGGDYYDYLDLGPGRLGLVLADISGKGFPAALLMANVQASLRSRSPEEMRDPVRQLRSVNQLLFRWSEANRFATLFLGIYDDGERRLCYANCGHTPPVLLRADGRVERLVATAPVLGLFEAWECTTEAVGLGPGDLLALFTDGVTEALGDDGEEFGDERVIEVLRGQGRRLASELVEAVMSRVREFSGGEQEDDLTLVVARGVPGAGRQGLAATRTRRSTETPPVAPSDPGACAAWYRASARGGGATDAAVSQPPRVALRVAPVEEKRISEIL
jgi:sigma-B regulation protein RsbU (phosphoserine phosphatase)